MFIIYMIGLKCKFQCSFITNAICKMPIHHIISMEIISSYNLNNNCAFQVSLCFLVNFNALIQDTACYSMEYRNLVITVWLELYHVYKLHTWRTA